MSSLLKNLLFALGLALIVWLGYLTFFKNSNDALVSSNGAVASEAVRETQEFLSKLQQLRALEHIKKPIFEDQRFRSLVDFRQHIEEEPTGRENPFAPIDEE